jgi:hypothetical protein
MPSSFDAAHKLKTLYRFEVILKNLDQTEEKEVSKVFFACSKGPSYCSSQYILAYLSDSQQPFLVRRYIHKLFQPLEDRLDLEQLRKMALIAETNILQRADAVISGEISRWKDRKKWITAMKETTVNLRDKSEERLQNCSYYWDNFPVLVRFLVLALTEALSFCEKPLSSNDFLQNIEVVSKVFQTAVGYWLRSYDGGSDKRKFIQKNPLLAESFESFARESKKVQTYLEKIAKNQVLSSSERKLNRI